MGCRASQSWVCCTHTPTHINWIQLQPYTHTCIHSAQQTKHIRSAAPARFGGSTSLYSTSFPLHLHIFVLLLHSSLSLSAPSLACLLSSLLFLPLIPLWDRLVVYEKQRGGVEMREAETHIREAVIARPKWHSAAVEKTNVRAFSTPLSLHMCDKSLGVSLIVPWRLWRQSVGLYHCLKSAVTCL